MTIIVTGGAGFIGANFVREWFALSDELVVTLDKLTYAGSPSNLGQFIEDPRHRLVEGDICDENLVRQIFEETSPRALLNFAAESHVDRSITGPGAFIRTNVNGAFVLLEATRQFLDKRSAQERADFRFLQVSTDEVYGSLTPGQQPFEESRAREPNSPYSASKAAADQFVRAYHHTYGVPVLTTHCSNNYGPLQFPEKLIPVVIERALSGLSIPLYGDGLNIRDWLHVSDHCAALRLILEQGQVGEIYNVGADNEVSNIDLVARICALLDELSPAVEGPYARLITKVADRPGHDRRYAINSTKLRQETGWKPIRIFSEGLRDTVRWYLENRSWTSVALARVAALHKVDQ